MASVFGTPFESFFGAAVRSGGGSGNDSGGSSRASTVSPGSSATSSRRGIFGISVASDSTTTGSIGTSRDNRDGVTSPDANGTGTLNGDANMTVLDQDVEASHSSHSHSHPQGQGHTNVQPLVQTLVQAQGHHVPDLESRKLDTAARNSSFNASYSRSMYVAVPLSFLLCYSCLFFHPIQRFYLLPFLSIFIFIITPILLTRYY